MSRREPKFKWQMMNCLTMSVETGLCLAGPINLAEFLPEYQRWIVSPSNWGQKGTETHFLFPLMSAMFNEYKRGEHKFLVILYCPLLYMCMFWFCDMMINYYNGKIKGDLASKSVIVRASLLTQPQRTMDKHISKLYPSSIIIGLRPWLYSKTLWLVWKMFLRMLFRYSRSIFYYLKLAS